MTDPSGGFDPGDPYDYEGTARRRRSWSLSVRLVAAILCLGYVAVTVLCGVGSVKSRRNAGDDRRAAQQAHGMLDRGDLSDGMREYAKVVSRFDEVAEARDRWATVLAALAVVFGIGAAACLAPLAVPSKPTLALMGGACVAMAVAAVVPCVLGLASWLLALAIGMAAGSAAAAVFCFVMLRRKRA